MPEFLTTHKTASYIEDVIMKAKARLVLVSPYLDLSDALFNRLKDADNRNVQVTLIYGKDKLKPERKNQLKVLRNLSLFFCKELHAKCYFNETTMVITSMNMYEFSEKNNREMGVLITKEADTHVYNEASEEVESILRASKHEGFRKSEPAAQHYTNSKAANKKQTKPPAKKEGFSLSGLVDSLFGSEGHCIRCGKTIPSDEKRPFCNDCYSKWASFKNTDYPEHYCHKCGKKCKTTKSKPLCRSCFSDIL